ncbi:hypothetical protein AcV5_004639 [Taiwanofungus camphoratus]|nr:hypothetical protein AcV5_004639 [Antrodia cinnamomea]
MPSFLLVPLTSLKPTGRVVYWGLLLNTVLRHCEGRSFFPARVLFTSIRTGTRTVMSKIPQPYLEQLGLDERLRLVREERKALAAERAAKDAEERSRILPREWITLQDVPSTGQRLRVMSWNLLAQSLVRRELFPTSDGCLKAKEREHMLYREILSHDADICCMQGLDRLDKLLPVLEKAGYSWTYASGPRKKHGCLIAYRTDAFVLVGERVIVYDEQDVREEGSERSRRGSSFRTKNIASLVRLRRSGSAHDGFVVATTHLFWHPSYTYERTRQAAILLREVITFRDEGPSIALNWPCVIAGDFNFQPDDPAYSLLVGDPLLPNQAEHLVASRVVHATIDPDIPTSGMAAAEEEEAAETGETDPDRIITNARAPVPSDGLLTTPELVHMFQGLETPKSAYDEGQRMQASLSESRLTFGSRTLVPALRRGAFEPVWTSYTHYWKSVLDYIFILDPPDYKVSVIKLAKPHLAEVLEPGLPQKGVCGSDHISLGAELHWPT